MPVFTFATSYSVISHGQRPYLWIISCGQTLFLAQGVSISVQLWSRLDASALLIRLVSGWVLIMIMLCANKRSGHVRLAM